MFGYVKKKDVLAEIEAELRIYRTLISQNEKKIKEGAKEFFDHDGYRVLIEEPIELNCTLNVHKIPNIALPTDIKIACESYNEERVCYYALNDLLRRLEGYPVYLRER